MSIRRFTLMDTSRRRSPSTLNSRSMMSRTRPVSSSVHAFTRLLGSTRAPPAANRLRRCVPCGLLSLALLVARVLTDDPNPAVPAHDLAVLAPNLDRRTYFHVLLAFLAPAPLRIRSARLRRARLLESIGDASAGEVVRRQLDLHL